MNLIPENHCASHQGLNVYREYTRKSQTLSFARITGLFSSLNGFVIKKPGKK